jgi:type I restriction enzyme R subunit
MPDPILNEKQLEEDIETYLTEHGGYKRGDPKQFDRNLALDTKTLLTFIQTTQPKTWEKYTTIYGEKSQTQFIRRVTEEITRNGLLKTLRTEIADRGLKFKLIYWKPETTINSETSLHYEQNILHCTRQLHYSPSSENSIDIVLFINGIPIISLELKNQFTGQNVTNAISQYQFDRSGRDPVFAFKNRVLVHFAVDLYEVWMTTRLAGTRSRFLPFNQGSNGPGVTGGKGNPASQNGDYPSSYLWKEILIKDTLIELLHKYLHIAKDEKTGKETLIFPRYHQLDVVTKLLRDVRQNGSGKNYLIQHSAGSGKSNSIAWLAHRLMGLHDNTNTKIFQSVIVVTDRKVLDSQLQDTIYQFDHVPGVVRKIDKNSSQLKEAINAGIPIIITTLQKFPVIYEEIDSRNRNFAVIVDEAHSSQTGESAKKLKKALAATEDPEEYARLENAEEEQRPDAEDKLNTELLTHGQHKNLSFFAFTATPKHTTLQVFGEKQPDQSYLPFHIYSMRQAIEEGFILDVLKNYTTYQMYYKIIKNIPDDPELETTAGQRAVKKYESLHPHNLAQKTAIIVEHFRNQTRHQIGGKAKAMLVTSSRLHAVRYLFEFRRYIKDQKYDDIDVLVAFSGEIPLDGDTWTEEKINKTKDGETIKEKQLPKEFHDNFNFLIVAEKYQTGFDEPYLHTMFVDKKLSGIKAVQTLSRLNRTMEGKEETFVLDFVNTADEIQKSFQTYYETTRLEEETDPNVLYDLKSDLEAYQIIQYQEVEAFAAKYFSAQNRPEKELLGKLSALLKPALDRYAAKPEEERDLFKSILARYIRIYGFITQIYRMYDKDLEKFYLFVKYLSKVLPKGKQIIVEIDDKILMEYYRLEKTYSGSLVLEPGIEGTLKPVTGFTGKQEELKDTLTEIIRKINEKYGTEFTNQDAVASQLRDTMIDDPHLEFFAQNNSEDMFATKFDKDFDEKLVNLYLLNDQFMGLLMHDEEAKKLLRDELRHEIYRYFRKAGEAGVL